MFTKIIANSIINQIKSRHHVYSGLSANALAEVANVLITLTALLEEGGALLDSPQEIKAYAQKAIISVKELADALTTQIGNFDSGSGKVTQQHIPTVKFTKPKKKAPPVKPPETNAESE